MTKRAVARPDNRLSFTDQLMFLTLRAMGQEAVVQCLWVYEHAVDLEGLKRFHRNAGHGLMGRRIERSPLPFGRHRWVSSEGPQCDLDIAECARPRAELSDWADERAQLPIDPEWGPSWHMGVLPLTDGSTAISVVATHCLADGFGGFLSMVNAVIGNVYDFGYPPPGSRTRLRAVVSDLRETVQGLPEAARALAAIPKLAFHRRQSIARSRASRPAAILDGADCNVVVPAVTAYVDLDDWDARAKALGGTSHSLFAGFTAKLAERLGRRGAEDGAVNLYFPVSERTSLDDTRANAASIAYVTVDPTHAAKDLSDIRLAIRQGLKTAREVPEEALQILPLTPFISKRLLRVGANVVDVELPVFCSSLGDLDPAIGRVDGTEADYVMLRGVDRYITRRTLEARRGILTVLGGRLVGKMSINIIAYQLGGENTKAHLRELATDTLAEFELTGRID